MKYLKLLIVTLLAGGTQLASLNAQNPNPPSVGSYTSGTYRNLMTEAGISVAAQNAKMAEIWDKMRNGDPTSQKMFWDQAVGGMTVGDSQTADALTEGQGYGMMICVQYNKKAEFDKIWYFAKTFMQHKNNNWNGLFGWKCSYQGVLLDNWPAPDGETWMTTALFLASRRWGNGTGIYNYSAEAQYILDNMRNKEATQPTTGVGDIFDPVRKLPRMSSGPSVFTDPSYCTPGYYSLWAVMATHDNQFWSDCATTGRNWIYSACHPTTGLNPDYANWDATVYKGDRNHDQYAFEAKRTNLHIGIDYQWWAANANQKVLADRIQTFFVAQGVTSYGGEYELSGRRISRWHNADHVGDNTALGLAATNARAYLFCQDLMNVIYLDQDAGGAYRYPGALSYFLGHLAASGNFRINNWVN